MICTNTAWGWVGLIAGAAAGYYGARALKADSSTRAASSVGGALVGAWAGFQLCLGGDAEPGGGGPTTINVRGLLCDGSDCAQACARALAAGGPVTIDATNGSHEVVEALKACLMAGGVTPSIIY